MTQKNDSSLCDAVRNRARQMIKDLAAAGRDLDCAEHGEGLTPLLIAIENGHLDMVRLLLDLGADPGARGKGWRKEKPLHLAARLGKLDLVQELLKQGADVNSVMKPHNGTDGHTPLMDGASSGNVDVVQCLLDNGANVNAINANGKTALFWAEGDDVADLLKQAVEATPIEVKPGALFAAVSDGLIDRVEALLTAGMSVEDCDSFGRTALMEAVDKNNLKIARLLIENGADVNHRSPKNWLPITSYTIKVRMARLLLENGADPNMTMGDETTALIWACQSGSKQLVKLMLEAGGEIKLDAPGQVKLLDAVRRYNRSVLPILRETLGVDEDETDRIRSHARTFPKLSQDPAFEAIADRLGRVFNRKPASWKRRKGVRYYYDVSLVKKLAAHFDEPAGDVEDESRAFDLLARFNEAVLEEGYILIKNDAIGRKGRYPLLLFPTSNKYAVLAAIGTNGVNYGHDTDAVIRWLMEMEQSNPFRLVDAGHDFLGGYFTEHVKDPAALADRMTDFCPDVRNFADASASTWTEQQVRTTITADLKATRSFMFWWD